MPASLWKTRLLAAGLCAAALLTAALAYGLALHADGRQTLVLGERGEPEETASLFFNALCLREWDTASSYVLGTPELALDREPAGELEREVWLAFQDSWSWSLGEGARTDSVSAWQEVTFTALRPELLTRGVTEEVQTVLAAWVDETDDLGSIYDDQGRFLPEVAQAALRRVLETRLAQPERFTAARPVTLHLTYQEGRWQILPEEALWEALSGGEGERE